MRTATWALAGLGLLLLGAAPASAQTNLLANPGFENGLSGWDYFGAVVSTSPVHSGQGAALLRAHGEPAPGGCWTMSNSTIYQGVPAVPGKVYTAQYWFRSEGPWNTMTLAFYGGGRVLSKQVESLPSAASWTQHTLVGTAPFGTESCALIAFCDARSCGDFMINLDDVLLTTPPTPQIRLSWNACESYVPNQGFTGQGVYRLVLSCTGVPATQYSAHDTQILVDAGPGMLPDAWRFDDAGCQTQSQVTYSNRAFSLACPAFQGALPLGLRSYSVDPVTGDGTLRVANTFDAFTAVSSTRYTLYVVRFDHAYSAVGESTPETCGGAEVPVTFTDFTTIFLETLTGDLDEAEYQGTENRVTWSEGFVAARKTTWGSLKGLYR